MPSSLVLHRYLLVMLSGFCQAAILGSVWWCTQSLSPLHQAGTEHHSSLYMAFFSSSPASGLPIQVYKTLAAYTCALVGHVPVSKVPLYPTAQLGIIGYINSTSWLGLAFLS